LSSRFFSALIVKYFKRGCKSDVYDFWLTKSSKKFILTRYKGSVNKMIDFIAEDSVEKHIKQFKSKKDDEYDLIYFNIKLRTRLNSIIKNIASGYYKTFEDDQLGAVTTRDIVNDQDEVISTTSNGHSDIFTATQKTIHTINYTKDDKYFLDKIIGKFKLTHKGALELIENVFTSKIKNASEMFEVVNIFLTSVFDYLDISRQNICVKDYPQKILILFNQTEKGKKARNKISDRLGIQTFTHSNPAIGRKVESIFIILLSKYFSDSYCKGD